MVLRFGLAVGLVGVALAVAAFVGLECGVRSLGWAMLRRVALVAVLGIVVVVHVAVEVGRAVKPFAGANEASAREPLRTIVAVRSAVVGSVVVVAVRAGGFSTDADINLCVRYGSG